jgi:uncharacterized protein (DUF1778 family)
MPFTRKKLASPKREYKTQRLELRLAPSAKKLIQQAMSVTGLAAGDLAYEGARRLLDEHQMRSYDSFRALPGPQNASSKRSTLRAD